MLFSQRQLGRFCSAHSFLQMLRTEIKLVGSYLEGGLEMDVNQSMTLGRTVHVHCSGLLGDRTIPVDTIVLFARWASNGQFSVSLKNTTVEK